MNFWGLRLILNPRMSVSVSPTHLLCYIHLTRNFSIFLAMTPLILICCNLHSEETGLTIVQ